jgi:hypothetical protein
VLTASLDGALERARLDGTALLLDARINPITKLDLGPALAASVETDQPLEGLRRAFRERASDVDADQRGAWNALGRRTSDALVASVNDGFAPGFGVGAGLAALAAVAIAPWTLRRRAGLVAAGVTAAVLLTAGYALAASGARAPPVTIADPCKPRKLPDTGGISGFAQNTALTALDRAACHAGSSREELVLALASDSAAKAYQKKYGVDPHSITSLLGAVIGG